MSCTLAHSRNEWYSCPPVKMSKAPKIFTIAYGEDADADLMLRIANRTNGQTFTGNPENIDRIYNSISAEQ